MLSRRPHHREAIKQAEARVRAYHVAIVLRVVRNAMDYRNFLKDVPPHCAKDAGMRLRLWNSIDDAEPLLLDEDGTVRL